VIFAFLGFRTLVKKIVTHNVTLKLRLHGRTALSLLVSKHGDANLAVWLRKAKIVGERTIDSNTVELTMPDWLARSERLS
jgi:hypothetical protein